MRRAAYPLGRAWRDDFLRNWHVGPWGVVVTAEAVEAYGVAACLRKARVEAKRRRRAAQASARRRPR